MYYFYVYGFFNKDILHQKTVLEKYLGLSLHEKDSAYYGAAYSFKNDEGENFLLQENFDGEGYLEEEYEKCPLIFNVTIQGQEAADDLKNKILSQNDAVLITYRQLSI